MNDTDNPPSRTVPWVLDFREIASLTFRTVFQEHIKAAACNLDGVALLWNVEYTKSRTYLSMGCVKRDEEVIPDSWNMEQNL